jgi:ATP-binding cassette subfamily B protein
MTELVHFLRTVLRLSFRISRRDAALAFVLVIASELAFPLAAVSLKFFADAVVRGQTGRAVLFAVLLAAFWIGQLTLGQFGYLLYFGVMERNTIALDGELMALMSDTPSMQHIDRPELAERLEALRTDSQGLYWAFGAIAISAGLFLQVLLTAAVLAWLKPALLVLPVLSLAPLVADRRAQVRVDNAREASAESRRVARHLLDLLTRNDAGKEIRVFGLADELRRRHLEKWQAVNHALWHAERIAVVIRVAGQLVVGLGYAGAVVLVVGDALHGHGTLGDVLLTVALASQVNLLISRAVLGVNDFQRMAKAVARYRWLREASGIDAVRSKYEPVPESIRLGIELAATEFWYPGADRPALSEVDLHLPGGSVIAVVGANGAGKTTLVKLVCAFYEPTKGAILVDGIDLRSFAPEQWRARVTGAFQDFQRYDLSLRENIGLGDVSRLDDDDFIRAAAERARASAVVDGVDGGLDAHLGQSYASGIDLSGGQWQRVALARGMMRPSPLVRVLDEPTAALDAHAEHEIFQAYAASAREQQHGGITLIVSHRFSTVSMADLIAVIDGGRVVEFGSHDELLAGRGLYAELFALQAAGYQ